MATRRAINSDEIDVLTVLQAVAVTGQGWRRGRVRGWLLGNELSKRLQSRVANLEIYRLREAGLVSGEAVFDAGRAKRPVVLWRITQAGAGALAQSLGHKPAVIPEPRPTKADASMIYVGRGLWYVLDYLQRNTGWARWKDLVTTYERRRCWVEHDDVRLLTNRGFIERRDEGTGSGKIIWLSATPLGRSVRLADGRTSTSYVQLRLPTAPEAG